MVALVGRMAMDQGKVMISPKELLVNTLMGGLQSKAVSSSCIVLQASLTVRRRMEMGLAFLVIRRRGVCRVSTVTVSKERKK